MSERRPAVSIGMPVRDGGATLARAIDCILAQDFTDFELLVSDNASTDSTREICESYARRDSRVRYSRNEVNVGAAANFNRVVDLASGEYFRWAAHDDMCAPTHLSRCLEGFRTGPPGTVLCYPRSLIIDADDRPTERYDDGVECLASAPHERLANMLRKLRLCHAQMGLVRLDALRRTRRIDRFRSSDVVLLSEIAMLGPIVEIPDYLFWRRRDFKTCGTALLTPDQQATWFDPRVKAASPFLRTTLFAQHFVSIARLPLGTVERARCCATVMSVWGPMYWRVMAGEFKIALRRKLRRMPAPPREKQVEQRS
jgi:glycosyltransferase involved in cell wall biosynthesis